MIKFIIVSIEICKCICSYDVNIKGVYHHKPVVWEVLFKEAPFKKKDTIIFDTLKGVYYYNHKLVSTDCSDPDIINQGNK